MAKKLTKKELEQLRQERLVLAKKLLQFNLDLPNGVAGAQAESLTAAELKIVCDVAAARQRDRREILKGIMSKVARRIQEAAAPKEEPKEDPDAE